MTHIVTVCTGNICRSPAAQLLLQRALPHAEVSSAGTYAMEGWGIPGEMLMCLDADGLEGRGHVARQYTATIASTADLIVCMTAEHRTRAVQEAPFALRRTFMLAELVEASRLGLELPGDTVDARVAALPEAMSEFRPALAGVQLWDVDDPFRQGQAVYDACYQTLRDAVDHIAQWVHTA